MSFSPEIALDATQAEAIARGLFAVAKCDGIHEREAALVASFWGEVGGGVAALADLERRPEIGEAELFAALPSAELRLMFLKSCVLLAWADGRESDAERAIIGRFAEGLGQKAQLGAIEDGVKEYLLGHLSHLANTDATVEVAKSMKL